MQGISHIIEEGDRRQETGDRRQETGDRRKITWGFSPQVILNTV
ncbi:hypothetical protein [Okeania sp. SIO2F5]|nr:hypothetical protein [Okeania sp. SIO2F5]